MIAGIAKFQLALWAVNWALAVFLLLLLVARRNYRLYPAFTFYISLNTLLGVFVFAFFRMRGVASHASWLFAWVMQGLTVCARAFAVVEIFRRVLSGFPGVWALARRLLVGSAAIVLLYSGLAARHQWQSAVPSADRAVELAMAASIVLLLLFARYYNVQIDPADRTLAIGFSLFSCFFVLNNTILERYMYPYATFWSLMGVLAYLASLMLWTSALWETRTASEKGQLLSPEVYQTLAPQINLRLRELDQHLFRTFVRGVPHR